VERRSIAGDRRSHAIFLTTTGRSLAEQGIAIQRDFVARTIGQLSEQQIAEFDAVLIATRDHLRSVTGTSRRSQR
jgi:DNA-binding MarR family transcriptional regulator